MTVVELIYSESAGQRARLVLAAAAAGLANTAIIALASGFAGMADGPALLGWLVFAALIGVFAVGARHTYHETVALIETALDRLKCGLAEKIGRADLEQLEGIGASEIYDRITENTSIVSNAAGTLCTVLQAIGVLVFAMIYVGLLSPPTFLALAGLLLLFVAFYRARQAEVQAELERMAGLRVVFFDKLMDLLRGFKEVKFSRARGRALGDDIVRTSDRLRAATTRFNQLFALNPILANCCLFVMLGVVAFVLPQYIELDGERTSRIIAAIMLLWTPLFSFVIAMSSFTRANQALREIDELAAKLDRAARPDELDELNPWGGRFTTLALRSIEYTYAGTRDERGFHIGPIDLELRAGEVVFIVGGNGSGKSTLLKVLTGLFPPTAGRITLDGATVDERTVAAYRELFTTIFTDFHLFAQLYGLPDVDEAEVHRLLDEMQLTTRTGFAGRRFTRRDLSTGQRKRLAMIVALLEDRPILMFDEWAADQDPEFRRYFYEELLPRFKRSGKTILAVSHDDRYFRCADRVYVMDEGRLHAKESAT